MSTLSIQGIFLKPLKILVLVFLCPPLTLAFTLPENFTDTAVIENLQDPDGFAFSPDGRIFISERITGKLRVATYNSNSDSWAVNATPFHTFDIPKDNGVPEAVRSAGLRDIAFDPEFLSNGYIYAFYMDDDTLHNRVIRITANAGNPDISDGSELLLIDLPFNSTSSSGSHNGGALETRKENNVNYLYITTGDGWEGEFAGDPVQSLSTFTGKVLRIQTNGTIPTANPFYNQTTGDYRAIYALGLRNPYSLSKHPDTDVLYINEARGSTKASIYIVEAAANYQHEGTGIGNTRNIWADATGGAGGELITGGAWMPDGGLGNYPATYNGRYFTALWGSNSSSTGQINTIASDTDTSAATFETGIGIVGSNSISVKPVVARFSANGDLYYMLTTYTTNSGQIRRIRYTALETVATPTFSSASNVSPNPIAVTIATTTPDADIYYTLNNTNPTTSSTLYNNPISITQSAVLRARAFKTDFNDSSEASAVYIIGDTEDNEPPDVDAGADKVGFTGQNISLDGSATSDPDGDDDFLTGEMWTQLSGPNVDILDATEEIAYFIPSQTGVYQFQLEVSDGIDTATDDVTITVIDAPRVQTGLQVLYTFEEGSQTTVNDVSEVGSPLNLSISDENSINWIGSGGLEITDPVSIVSSGASKIISACQMSNQISIEAWLETNNLLQDGPARIASLSTNTLNRNFTLGQEDDRYDVRLRTTSTDLNGTPSLTVPASTVKTELQHVIYTRDDNGNASIYINGVPQVVGTVGGNLSNWNTGYNLILGNEITDDRPWLGELYLVAVYCAALTSEQVSQNFSAGLPPYAEPEDTDDDDIIDLLDNCPTIANTEQTNTDDDALGDVCDDDKDNDGVNNILDDDELVNAICQDSDSDMCDDCAIGVDGFGPLSDATPNNDGLDTDDDGECNVGDIDDDDDMVPDATDNCPTVSNPDQLDSDDNDIGDACDPSAVSCFVVSTSNGRVVTFCL